MPVQQRYRWWMRPTHLLPKGAEASCHAPVLCQQFPPPRSHSLLRRIPDRAIRHRHRRTTADTFMKPVQGTHVAMPYAQPATPDHAYVASNMPYAVHVQTNSGVCVEPGAVPANNPNAGLRVGEWGAPFCGCCTHVVPNCCMATFLPCVSLAQISSRLGLSSYSNALSFFGGVWVLSTMLRVIDFSTSDYVAFWTSYDGTDDYYNYSYSLGIWGYLASMLSMIFTIGVWQLRLKTRERFSIPGNCMCDCCASFCCSCCTIAQMATHIKSYKPGTCDFGPVDTLPPFH